MSRDDPHGKSVDSTGQLCKYCRQFTDDLFGFNFTQPTNLPERWQDERRITHPRGIIAPVHWGPSFHHHQSFDALLSSANICEMCHVLQTELKKLDSDSRRGWLGFYPWWAFRGFKLGASKGRFKAAFRDSLDLVPLFDGGLMGTPSHCFKICQRKQVAYEVEGYHAEPYKSMSVAPTSLTLERVSETVKRWETRCHRLHPKCREGASSHSLPTRVIDLGAAPTDTARIYESKGEKLPYVALTHCWGGAVPSMTTKSNIKKRLSAMTIDDLPKTFRDAIEVARVLRIRYAWIDAICIIQDSEEDWKAEVAKMASVYAGAVLVVSALEASSSTAGFLNKIRAPEARLNDEYSVQKAFPQFSDYMTQCPLSTRGWCVQERLLATTILHFGEEEMFWECRTGAICEHGQVTDLREHSGDISALRRSVFSESSSPWSKWYRLLESYTARNLTKSSDKLPALAAAASRFRAHNPGATYVAGLWKEDLARGLLWGAHYHHGFGRPVWGYRPSDECSPLKSSDSKRAPSWSWAALDGQIDFWTLRVGDHPVRFEILEIGLIYGENNFLKSEPRDHIKMRGPIAAMVYQPPAKEGGHVGSLTFSDATNDRSVSFNGCVLDTDRHTRRTCKALLSIQKSRDWYMLILDLDRSGCHRRIGFCTAYSVDADIRSFAPAEILLR